MADLSDRTDNVSLTNDNATKVVTVTTDGATERLDVSLGDENSFQGKAFEPRVNFSVAGTALAASPTWTTLITVTDAGKLDFVAITATTDNYRVRLTVDSVVIFNMTMDDITALGLDSSNSILWTEAAAKNFRYRLLEPVDFETNFTLEAQLTSGSPTVTWLTHHRIHG